MDVTRQSLSQEGLAGLRGVRSRGWPVQLVQRPRRQQRSKQRSKQQSVKQEKGRCVLATAAQFGMAGKQSPAGRGRLASGTGLESPEACLRRA